MKYEVIAKIVGPYLPDSYSVDDIILTKENFDEVFPLELPSEDSAIEKHLEEVGVGHRIAYNKEKPHYRKFESPHIIRITIEDENPYEVFILARIRIEQLVESLTIASFNTKKIHPHTGKKLSRNIADIYQYQIVSVREKDSGKEVERNRFTTGINYFPKLPPDELIELTNEILSCNDETLRKAMHYLKRAKTFSFDYYSELEVFLNSMKCIELLAYKFYPYDLRKKEKKKTVNFRERMEGFEDNPGVFELLSIDSEYRDLSIRGWKNRSSLDIAHASEYFHLIASPFPEDVNKTAYHFVLKYIYYLKQNEPHCFWKLDKLDSDWWAMFR